METTRHFTATTYVVTDGATALHHHDKLDMWLPPGGHIDRDELPRAAARREVHEEIGQEVTLHEPETAIETGTVSELPGPEYLLLEDIHSYAEGQVGHQHIDFIYFGSVPSREIHPQGDGERGIDHWEWFEPEDLRSRPELSAEVREIGLEAIEVVDGP
jgi:8-oxo-dGTP pyrophosphatase MutT (NUDIX family)